MWKNGAYVSVDVNNLIEAGKICVAINESGESTATIRANKIYLLGQTIANTITADLVQSRIGQLNVLSTRYINANGNINSSGNVQAAGLYLVQGQNSVSMANAVKTLQIKDNGNNTYTLQKKDFDDGDWVDVGTFSRATTLTGAWSSGVYTVTASPQGNHISTAIDMDPNGGSWSNGTFTRNVVYNNGQNYYPTGITAHAYIYKSNINLTRGSVTPTEPSADATLLRITANGWYVLSISVHGITKTYKLQIAAS